jgi:hypothetical protein
MEGRTFDSTASLNPTGLQLFLDDASAAGGGRVAAPGAFPWSAWRKLRITSAMLVAVARAAPRSFPAFMRPGTNTERLHPRGRHWNPETMGITRSAQGQSIGGRLLARDLFAPTPRGWRAT